MITKPFDGEYVSCMTESDIDVLRELAFPERHTVRLSTDQVDLIADALRDKASAMTEEHKQCHDAHREKYLEYRIERCAILEQYLNGMVLTYEDARNHWPNW